MACCLFAAMIITNFLVIYRKIKSFFGFKPDGENGGATQADSPRWFRAVKLALPVLMVSATALYGTLHWHHITDWLDPASQCSANHRHHDCGAPDNKHD